MMVIVLGMAYERRLKAIWPAAILLGLIAPAAAVLFVDGRFDAYYGLSGLTHTLMTVVMLHELRRGNHGWPFLVLAGWLIWKVCWGMLGPGPLVEPELPDGTREAPIAHLAGALAGVLVSCAAWRTSIPRSSAPILPASAAARGTGAGSG